eukprot:TRINITY_DN3551_c0_g1_i1.p1 TRINITY_DN3551_c0_g1~~TRINITY_DN3551_c0_g1_i1.p1  ORF type:complete len:125 (+),score=13.83 TRINITY_DN3551_c0_g1_i1:76-450(+)
MRLRRRHVVGGATLGLACTAWSVCFLTPMPRPGVVQREPRVASSREPDAAFGSSFAPLGLGMVAGACGVMRRVAVSRRGHLAMGDDAPQFTLPDESGNMISLENLVKKGMQVLIWWYPKANTPG